MIHDVSLMAGSIGGDHVNDVLSTFKPHWDLYPKTYVAQKISFPLIDHLDGDLTKDVWKNAKFSDLFDDIRGEDDAPDADRPDSKCHTRFKAVWDENHLYIGAILASDFETQAHFTERNSPIYQRDSDFEVFVDPFGSCHNYKELEVNAINTVWNLMLNRPYDDGGEEFSGRIAKPGDERFYEVYGQKTAAKLVSGALNQPGGSATWSVEIALAYKDLLVGTKDKDYIPSEGSMMRINFSRVERQGALNWTWQPQIVWDPETRKYRGYVAMHLPDAWGYIIFGSTKLTATIDSDKNYEVDAEQDDSEVLPIKRDRTWPARCAAMNIYYAQRYFSMQNNGNYADSLEKLGGLLDEEIVRPFHIKIELFPGGYIATVTENSDGICVTVTNDRLLEVVNPEDEEVTSA